MISVQTKKLIDFHCHVLPNMDDGSKSINMSAEMLEREAEQGVGVVCATSHYYADVEDIPTFCTRRSEAYERLENVLGEGLPKIVLAAEVKYFPSMEEQPLESLCVKGTRTLMLEMPFTNWTDLQVETATTLVLDCGYRVILAHPERFCFSKENYNKLKLLANLPIGWQINASSLTHWTTRRLALELLEMGRYPLLGSDCHDLTKRPPNLKEGRAIIRKKLGEAFLDQMDENSESALWEMEWSS